jgi:hypothetical protein
VVGRSRFTFSTKGHGTENDGHSRILIIGHDVCDAAVGRGKIKGKLKAIFARLQTKT